jgi:hypothetical protein
MYDVSMNFKLKTFFCVNIDGDRFLVSTDVWKFILLFL